MKSSPYQTDHGRMGFFQFSHWLYLLNTVFSALIIGFPSAHGAALSKSDRSSTLRSGIASNPPNFSAQCTNLPTWLTPDFSQDCAGAVMKFDIDVDRYEARLFEFRQKPAHHRTRYPGRVVPRFYVGGKCTIAIALIGAVIPAHLFPAPEPVPRMISEWPEQDLDSYEDLRIDLSKVYSCTNNAGAGWVRAGVSRGLGLFIVGTDSLMDKALRGSSPPLPSVAVLNESHSAILPKSLDTSTSLSSTTSNHRTTLRVFHEQCTSNRAWRIPSFSKDCPQALQKFWDADVFAYGKHYFSFQNSGEPPIFAYQARFTPKRYTVDKCTIAIAMLESFPQHLLPPPLPEPPASGWPKNDTGNFADLYAGLGLVLTWCADSPTPAGWVRAGGFGGMGLFMFATGSTVDTALFGSTSPLEPINGTISGKISTGKFGGGSSDTA